MRRKEKPSADTQRRGARKFKPTIMIEPITFIRTIASPRMVLILGTTFVPVRRTCRIVLHDVYKEKPLGDDLLSQEAALQVPSALTGLTTGFGMLPGVPPSLKSPRDVFTTLG